MSDKNSNADFVNDHLIHGLASDDTPITAKIKLTLTNHNLKTWPEYFWAVHEGRKTFEARVNDRDFKVGDIVTLHEYDPTTQAYSGKCLVKLITYILTKPEFVRDGMIIFSIKSLY